MLRGVRFVAVLVRNVNLGVPYFSRFPSNLTSNDRVLLGRHYVSRSCVISSGFGHNIIKSNSVVPFAYENKLFLTVRLRILT